PRSRTRRSHCRPRASIQAGCEPHIATPRRRRRAFRPASPSWPLGREPMTAPLAMVPLTAPHPDKVAPAVEHRVLSEFRRAAADVPAYRTLLDEEGIRASDVCDLTSFSRLCPLLSKRNTFDRFPLDQLSVGGRLLDIA